MPLFRDTKKRIEDRGYELSIFFTFNSYILLSYLNMYNNRIIAQKFPFFDQI